MRRILLVLLGGFCGTIARALLAAPLLGLAHRTGLPASHAGFPYDIFAINLGGALAMGFLYGLFERGAALPPDARITLGTGFLGAFTTFSSFVVGGDKLLTTNTVAGLLYLFGSLALGILCATIGYEAAFALLDWRQARLRAFTAAHRDGTSTSVPPRPSRGIGRRQQVDRARERQARRPRHQRGAVRSQSGDERRPPQEGVEHDASEDLRDEEEVS